MSRYTEKLIMQNFGEMLDEMPFDKVTVSALTRRCDISHNTFYYHYRDIYDLLEIWVRREIDQYIGKDSGYADWESSMTAMLRRWQSVEQRIYHVFGSLSREQLERHIYEQAEPVFLAQIRSFPEAEHVSEEQLQLISSYARYLFFGFLMRFLWGKMKDDVESSVHDLTVLLSCFITHAVEDANNGKL
jgi:AcrR family transcriptional regulator